MKRNQVGMAAGKKPGKSRTHLLAFSSRQLFARNQQMHEDSVEVGSKIEDASSFTNDGGVHVSRVADDDAVE